MTNAALDATADHRRLGIALRGAGSIVVGAALTAGLLAGAAGGSAQQAPTPTPITFTVIGPTPTATAAPAQPAAPSPTATSAPSPTATPEPIDLTFAADDWQGGLYRGNGEFYGRAWVAVYGAQSDFPRAALTFELPLEPTEPLAFSVDGLDDEWADRNEIAFEINGQRVYEGPSPFLDWDGILPGTNAVWTTATLVLPPGLLREGANEVVVQNLEQSASVGLPPYVLLSTAALYPAPPELLTPTADDLALLTPTAGANDGDDDDDGGNG